MKVNHKTFSGGYKFDNFEGRPEKVVKTFKPTGELDESLKLSAESMTASGVLESLGLAGFEGPESALVPTEGTIEPQKVTDIIVSTVEVEPYNFPNLGVLSDENVRRFYDGLKNIRQDYSNAKVTIVFDENQSELIKALEGIADNLAWVEFASIVSKYPANLKELTIPTVLDKKYPIGYAPAHIGVLFLTVRDVLQVTKSAVEKKSADTAFVALAGSVWKENLVLEVPVGTAIKDIASEYLKDEEVRLVKNSLLTGTDVAEGDLVTYDTSILIAIPEDKRRQTLFFLRAGKNADSFSNSFLAKLLPNAVKRADTNLHGERRACVSCTYCQKVCPVGLIPHLLHKHVDKEIINERLAEYKIFDCIECGLCDYVCPSKIEVSSDIKRGKKMLEKTEISHTKYQLGDVDMILEPKEVEIDG